MIYEFFSEMLNNQQEEKQSNYSFDGSLNEFLEAYPEDSMSSLLSKCTDLQQEFYVCTNFSLPVAENVTNQIIRYKDIFKVPQPSLVCPYLLYWKQGDEKKVILLNNYSSYSYLTAKGLYFCLTEPNGFFSQYRNQILALSYNPENADECVNTIQSVVSGKISFGAAQRYYDRKYLKDMENMKMISCEASLTSFNACKEACLTADDRAPLIYDAVATCFLLKKAMYVQFMMAKNLLETRFENNIKKQRQCAKQYSDEIPFVSYSALWRYGTELEEKKVTEEA